MVYPSSSGKYGEKYRRDIFPNSSDFKPIAYYDGRGLDTTYRVTVDSRFYKDMMWYTGSCGTYRFYPQQGGYLDLHDVSFDDENCDDSDNKYYHIIIAAYYYQPLFGFK
jgi:hypothetical protein